MKSYLILDDGTVYAGRSFGRAGEQIGEVVFNTGMTGYQEVLSDPSYRGQIVTLTYPLIGNYGINEEDFESRRLQVSGFIVKDLSQVESNWRSSGGLHEFLDRHGVMAIQGIDTRALTRHLRSHGVMMGLVTPDPDPAAALAKIKASAQYAGIDFVSQVSTDEPYTWPLPEGVEERFRVVLIDYGVKFNILRSLASLGCSVTVLPCHSAAGDVLAYDPDGVFLSPGPGDPERLDYAVDTLKALLGKRPIMGICLGHQLLGRAFGGKTYKLKFGHRGANHPVKDLDTGRVHITSQNHGYAVDADTVKDGAAYVSHINLNDNTVEGFGHRELPVFSVQYHPEASPGPRDNWYLFEKFISLMLAHK
ncbi:MAG: glutamine-hydrolyzing carbamoyl-phosphate synthase small subunit [bacterium]|nr:glutamine-hydrolyzing carbamoyl-phosphate synthase small subunit [bacterium]